MPSTLREGDWCAACPGGQWSRYKVLRCYDDGTYKLAPDGAPFMGAWDGVTRDEISFDDDALFTSVFDGVRDDKPAVGKSEVVAALRRLGFVIDDARFAELWQQRMESLFGKKDDEGVSLDRDETYRFFLSVGVSAKRFVTPANVDPGGELFKLYWNGVRMGGRSPGDVGRPIGLADTLAAYRLDAADADADMAADLARFEAREKLVLPASLRALWTRRGALEALRDGHCNNPEPLDGASFRLVRRSDEPWGFAFALRFMVPHQGDHAWWLLFDDHAEDGEVWLSIEEGGGPAVRVARSLSFFFWDLRETGRVWYEERAAR